jgi:hypothetical protein
MEVISINAYGKQAILSKTIFRDKIEIFNYSGIDN